MIPITPVDILTADTMTVRANICYEGRQRGPEWCMKHCDGEVCRGAGHEYYRRLNGKPEPVKKKPVQQTAAGEIPYFEMWLGDYLARNKISRSKFARMIGVHATTICDLINHGVSHTRAIERKVILFTGLSEETITTQAAALAYEKRKEREKENHGVRDDIGHGTRVG